MKISHSLTELQERIHHAIVYGDISRFLFHLMVSIVLGIAAGGGAVLFHVALDTMKEHFAPTGNFLDINTFYIVLIPVTGALVTSLMTRLFRQFSKERGVIGIIKSLLLKDGYLSARGTLFQAIAPVISIGTGIPLGPEGPAARLGSGIGSIMSRIFKLQVHNMKMYTAAGAGAAISAVFNAPITGVFFGVEVILLNDMKNQALSALIVSSVVADILSRAVLGNSHIIQLPRYDLGDISTYPFYIVMGIVCGLCALLYFKTGNLAGTILDKKLKIKNEYLRLLPLSLLFGFVLINYYHLFGLGYGTIHEVINSRLALETVLILLFLKIIFVAFFLRAGAYGGTFAPSLLIGVLLGYSFARIGTMLTGIPLDPVSFSIVAMGGVLAGINSIPLTSILLVFEISSDYRFILPLMLVSIIAHLISFYYNRGTVYQAGLKNCGIDISKRSEVDLLGKISVGELMSKKIDRASFRTPFRELSDIILKSRYGDVIITGDRENILGIVSLMDIRQALMNNELVDLLIAGDIMRPVPQVFEHDTVSSAMQKIKEYDLENIPVADSDDPEKTVGILTHFDIIQAYNKNLEEWETNQILLDFGDRPGLNRHQEVTYYGVKEKNFPKKSS